MPEMKRRTFLGWISAIATGIIAVARGRPVREVARTYKVGPGYEMFGIPGPPIGSCSESMDFCPKFDRMSDGMRRDVYYADSQIRLGNRDEVSRCPIQ